jgi:mannose-6-phosphate isomerase-like protein (cupin superfamily)
MRTFMFCIGVLLMTTSTVSAQQAPAQAQAPTIKTYTSAAEVVELMAKAKSERKPDQGIFSQRLLELAPYRVNLEYRAALAPAAVHEKEAEVFYVVEGSATMVTGGKLANETRTNATNLSGTGIENGVSRTVAKGDFIVVPENTPHWFSSIHDTLVVMTFHIPRPVVATP